MLCDEPFPPRALLPPLPFFFFPLRGVFPLPRGLFSPRRGVFLLPTTYYVKLLEYGDEFCKVEYLYDDEYAKRLVGYTHTNDLAFVDYQPKRPYLYYLFDVKYTIADADETNSSFLTQITITCAYYGDYKIGSELYCYVLRGGEFGYVPKPNSIQYEENTEYADYLAQLSPEQSLPASSQSKSSSPVLVAILVVLCLLIPLL